MPLPQLDNLVRTGQLKAEPPAQAEIDGLMRSGNVRLKDVGIEQFRKPFWSIIVSMSSETVVALPDDLKAVVDRRAPNPPERDELIAAALRAYFAWPVPGEDASDLAIINAHAEELNAEAEDALSYQVPL